MKPAWWLLLAVPVAVLVLLDEFGDGLFGVREVRPPSPADAPPAVVREEIRGAFGAWNGIAPSDPELADVLRKIGAAAAAGRVSDVTEHFDCERLYDEVTRSDLFARSRLPLDPATGPQLLRSGLWDAVRAGGPDLVWDRVEIRKVVEPAAAERVVYARHSTGGRSGPYRWRLVRTPAGWKAFDVEDVRVGLRLSYQAAGLFARGGEGDLPANLLAGLTALRETSDLLGAGKTVQAMAALGPARAVTLPREQYVLRCVLEGAIAALGGRAGEALEWADRADAATSGLPAADFLRASAFASVRNWPGAERHARRYIELLGPDAAANRILGTALRELGRPTEAAAAFEQGLRDDPTRADLKAAVSQLRDKQ